MPVEAIGEPMDANSLWFVSLCVGTEQLSLGLSLQIAHAVHQHLASVLLGTERDRKRQLSQGELFRLLVLDFCLFTLHGVQLGVIVSVRG